MKRPKTGKFKFTREHVDIHGKVTHEDAKTLHNCDASWPEVLQEFVDFLKGCGFSLPQGEIEFIKQGEVVVNKTEAILFAKDKLKRKSSLEDDEDIKF